MNINLIPHANNSSNQSSNSSNSSGVETDNMFLTLLTEQLKSQSPFDPVDPEQFVGQLVQFNTLDQLMQIRQILQQGLGAPSQSGNS